MKYDWSDPKPFPYWDYEYPYFFVNDREQYLAAGVPLEETSDQNAASIGVLVQELGSQPSRRTVTSIAAVEDLITKSAARAQKASLDVSNQYTVSVGGLSHVMEQDKNTSAPRAVCGVECYPLGAVAIGVVDSAMSFANARFRTKGRGDKPDQSRIEFLWLMGRKAKGSDGAQQITKTQIDTWLAANFDPLTGQVDEDKIYQNIMSLVENPEVRPRAEQEFAFPHGTQILDLAAGYPAETQVNNRPILAVELPTQAVADTSCARMQGHLLDAVREILVQSRSLKDRNGDILPLVLNISLAITAGPHDGSHPIEVSLDRLIENERRQHSRLIEVFMPAGNHRQDRLHAKMHLPSAAPTANVDWNIYPDDRTASFVEIWQPIDQVQYEADHCLLQVQLTPPGCAETEFTPSTAPGKKRLLHYGQDQQATIFFSRHIGRDGFFERVVIGVSATEPVLPNTSATKAGAWKIGLMHRSEADLSPDLWIQRDETLPGFRSRGRQSRFADADYEKYDTDGRRPLQDLITSSVVTRSNTGSAMATGRHTTLVTAQRNRADGTFDAEYSGHSPKAKNATAIVDQRLFSRGVLATGRRSGSVSPISGTSAASALVTRRRADELEAETKGSQSAQFFGSRELFRWIV